LFAQQTLGFSNPQNIDPLLDYRLPDWGYTNFQIGFNLLNNGGKTKAFSTEDLRYSYNLSATPTYELYRESEERIFSLATLLNLGYQRRLNRQQSSAFNSESEDKENEFLSRLFLNANYKRYVADNSFILAASGFDIAFRRRSDQQSDGGQLIEEQIQHLRFINFSPRIGYGFGRIRNVGPVIRALRMRERARALNVAVNFTNEDIQSAADQFTRYQGYLENYDRPQKYFWGDMDNATTTDLSALDTFDMLYLTDVLDEAIGTRLEGWEVTGGAVFNYSSRLDRVEEDILTRNYLTTTEAGVFISGRWYKNTSLVNQFGLFSDFTLTYPLNQQDTSPFDDTVQRTASMLIGASWLYNITDRVLLQTSLADFYTRTKIENSLLPSNYSQWSNQIQLSMDLSVYVENDLSLNFSLSPFLRYSGDTVNEGHTKFFFWRAAAGFVYGFSNSLY
jgi:hypothetical protein